MKKQIITTFAATIVALVLILLLLFQIQMDDFIDILTEIKPLYLVIGFIFYLVSYFFKALRFRILLNKEVGFMDLFSIVCVHNMTTNIFPARSGELSYVYLLKKYHNKAIGENIGTLIIVRIFDIIIISLMFFISTLLLHNPPSIMEKALPIVGYILFLVVVLVLMFVYNSNRFVSGLRNVLFFFKLNDKQIVDYLFYKLDEMTTSLSRIRRDQLIWSALISTAIWIILYFVYYILLIAMGIELTFAAVLLASTFVFIISIIPVQGIGGFGTFETAWAISFISVGVMKESAISSGFFVHVIGISYLSILFLFGLIILSKKTIN